MENLLLEERGEGRGVLPEFRLCSATRDTTLAAMETTTSAPVPREALLCMAEPGVGRVRQAI